MEKAQKYFRCCLEKTQQGSCPIWSDSQWPDSLAFWAKQGCETWVGPPPPPGMWKSEQAGSDRGGWNILWGSPGETDDSLLRSSQTCSGSPSSRRQVSIQLFLPEATKMFFQQISLRTIQICRTALTLLLRKELPCAENLYINSSTCLC